jgi:hypothetical protein
MAWRIAGTYLASCSCQLLCPCPTDNPPTGPDGQCTGAAVFQVAEGELDGTDLSGTDFGFYNFFPSNLSSGNWKIGLVISDSASDEQASALERIVKGEEGGPFAEFANLYGEWLGTERDSISFSGGDKPSATVGDATSIDFEPLEGPAGGHTTVKNAMFGFAPEFRVGHGPGKSERFGLTFDPVYGETADYEFSTEQGEEAVKGRV